MLTEFHTQMGFHELQRRLLNRVGVLAGGMGLLLGQEVMWMDGKRLPTPGEPVVLALRLPSGEHEPVTLESAQLAAWMEGGPSNVERTLRQALDTLKAQRPPVR